jgi:hypothetical protein
MATTMMTDTALPMTKGVFMLRPDKRRFKTETMSNAP